MRSFWNNRRLIAVPATALLFIVQAAFSQRGSPGGAPPAGPGNSGSNSRSTIPGNTTPTIGNVPPTNAPMLPRPIFLSGKVMFDDGSQTNPDVRIERVCGGSVRLEGHTDGKGRFSFQVGQNQAALMDASDTQSDPFGNSAGSLRSPSGSENTTPTRTSGGNQVDPLWDCELRAAYPGFRSDMIDLSTRRSLDNPDVGTIVLHRLGNVQGTTISLTTAQAPKHAQKAYEKGLQAEQKSKLDEAEKDFAQATDLYPKYAVAWFALGQLQQREGKTELARKSYLASAQADSRYLSPYDRLAYLSLQENKWEEGADYSKHVIELNSVEFPTSFWYNAVANYQLKRPEQAEKSLTELLKLDTQHRFPDAENMMAQIMLDKGKYPEAAAHLRAYLALVPNAKNADALKATLMKIDQASSQIKPPQPQQ
jgi:tetratricopeptide (TPR) repeat protein